MIIKNVQSFCNEMKVTDRCTFLEGWLQNFKHQHLQDTYKWKIPLFSCAAQERSSIKILLLRKLVQYTCCMIIWNLAGPTGARYNEFYCTIIKHFVCVGTSCCHSVQNHSPSLILLFTELPPSDLNPCYFIHRGHFSVHCSAATVAKLIIQNKKHCKGWCQFPHKICKQNHGGVSMFN